MHRGKRNSMAKHRGTWAHHRTPREIIENGKDLAVQHAALSHKEFVAYAHEKYSVHYQVALIWVRIAQRFDVADLPQEIPESILGLLGTASLAEEDAWLIIDAIKSKRISRYRTVQEIVRYLCGPSLRVAEEVRAFLAGEAAMPDARMIEAMKASEEIETRILEAELREASVREAIH